MILKRILVFYFLSLIFFIASLPQQIYAQASLQRKVNISNTNGNLISLQSAIGVQPYTLTFPVSVNPSGTIGSILYGMGSGNMAWTDAASVTSGFVLTMKLSGGNLIPTWTDPLTLNFWSLSGNSGTTAWNGTTGNFIGTTNTQPIVIATTNTATPQPIEFYTANTEKMRLSQTGNLGIGTTNPSQLLQVNNGNIFLSNSGTGGQLQLQGTGSGITTFQAGAQGAANINYTFPIGVPSVDGQVLSATSSGTMSWASVGSVTSVGLALPGSLFGVSGSPVTLSGTLTGTLLTQPSNTIFAGPMSGGATAPNFRMLVAADIPALNYVSSVGLSLPASLFSVSGSPVTSTGTLTGSLATQGANIIFAGPISGITATPTFRSMVTADIPNNIVTYAKIQNETNNTVLGNVSGIGAAPSELTSSQLKTLLNLTNTNSGDVTLAGENYLSLSGQQITANPINLTGTNITGLLKAASFPILTGDITTTGGSLATTISNGAVTLAKMANFPALSIMGNPTGSSAAPSAITLGAGLSFSGTTLVGTGGTITSVGLALPASVFSVSGSPVTGSGTLTGSFATQAANTIFAGPSLGVAVTPSFRTLVTADIPNSILTYAKIQNETNNTVLGNVSGIGAAPSELTSSQLKTLLNLTNTNSGDVTLAGENYLSLSGQQITANPINLTGTNITGLLKAASFPILTGDITTTGGSLATTISNGAVTLAKMANFPALSIMGNPTGSSAAPSAITLGAGLSFSGTTLTATELSGGVLNTIPKWTSATALGNSSITDNGTIVSTNETLRLGTVSANTGSFVLANASSANLTTLQAGNATSAVTYILPIANGTNGQVLYTDGNNPAQLSWITAVTSSNGVQYNVGSAQNNAGISNGVNNYLFNVSYGGGGAGNPTLPGAVINSTINTGSGGSATGLTISTAVHNSGQTETGLIVSTDGTATTDYTGIFYGGNAAFTNSTTSPTPTNVLEVTQSSASNTNDAMKVTNSATGAGNAITASASGTGAVIKATMTGTGYAGVFTGGAVGIGTAAPTQLLHLKNGHIRSEQTTKPTIAVTTQNGITAAAISNGSTDTRGTITTTGTNNGGINTVLTVTFNSTCTNAPVVMITPANATAQTALYFVTSTATTFALNFLDGANATPSFNYMVIE